MYCQSFKFFFFLCVENPFGFRVVWGEGGILVLMMNFSLWVTDGAVDLLMNVLLRGCEFPRQRHGYFLAMARKEGSGGLESKEKGGYIYTA